MATQTNAVVLWVDAPRSSDLSRALERMAVPPFIEGVPNDPPVVAEPVLREAEQRCRLLASMLARPADRADVMTWLVELAPAWNQVPSGEELTARARLIAGFGELPACVFSGLTVGDALASWKFFPVAAEVIALCGKWRDRLQAEHDRLARLAMWNRRKGEPERARRSTTEYQLPPPPAERPRNGQAEIRPVVKPAYLSGSALDAARAAAGYHHPRQDERGNPETGRNPDSRPV